MKIEVRAYKLSTGQLMHITGEWKTIADMEHELQTDGFVIVRHVILNERRHAP